MGWKSMGSAQVVASENLWTKRSKVYKAKTFAALKDLYGYVKPGHEPKGITTVKGVKDGQVGNDVAQSAEKEKTQTRRS